MAIKATCLACSREYNLGDHLAGEMVECKACRTAFVVPVPDADSGGADAALTADAPAEEGGTLFDRARKRNRDRMPAGEEEEERPDRQRADDDHDQDDRPGGRKARGGLPGWVWGVVAVVGLAGLGVLAFLVVASTRGAPVTEETYAKIAIGMGFADVKKLMGEPHETSGGDTNNPNRGGVMDTWAWKSGDNKIYVFLMGAKVSSKMGKFGTKTVQESGR